MKTSTVHFRISTNHTENWRYYINKHATEVVNFVRIILIRKPHLKKKIANNTLWLHTYNMDLSIFITCSYN